MAAASSTQVAAAAPKWFQIPTKLRRAAEHSNWLPKPLKGLLIHPAGPLTIHFWAPAWKWGLVVAGIADLKRPAENISRPQSIALTATGVIWSRYATQIIPVNYNLLSVNVFVAATVRPDPPLSLTSAHLRSPLVAVGSFGCVVSCTLKGAYQLYRSYMWEQQQKTKSSTPTTSTPATPTAIATTATIAAPAAVTPKAAVH